MQSTQLVASFVISLASAAIAVYFALWRFRRETWWKKKAEIYESILDALYRVGEYIDFEFDNLRAVDAPANSEREDRLGKQYAEGLAELRRQADIGSFTISAEAIEALQQFQRACGDSKKTTSWSEHLIRMMYAVDSCKSDILRAGRNDLGVARSPAHIWWPLKI
jgi:hypothetical protein